MKISFSKQSFFWKGLKQIRFSPERGEVKYLNKEGKERWSNINEPRLPFVAFVPESPREDNRLLLLNNPFWDLSTWRLIGQKLTENTKRLFQKKEVKKNTRQRTRNVRDPEAARRLEIQRTESEIKFSQERELRGQLKNLWRELSDQLSICSDDSFKQLQPILEKLGVDDVLHFLRNSVGESYSKLSDSKKVIFLNSLIESTENSYELDKVIKSDYLIDSDRALISEKLREKITNLLQSLSEDTKHLDFYTKQLQEICKEYGFEKEELQALKKLTEHGSNYDLIHTICPRLQQFDNEESKVLFIEAVKKIFDIDDSITINNTANLLENLLEKQIMPYFVQISETEDQIELTEKIKSKIEKDNSLSERFYYIGRLISHLPQENKDLIIKVLQKGLLKNLSSEIDDLKLLIENCLERKQLNLRPEIELFIKDTFKNDESFSQMNTSNLNNFVEILEICKSEDHELLKQLLETSIQRINSEEDILSIYENIVGNPSLRAIFQKESASRSKRIVKTQSEQIMDSFMTLGEYKKISSIYEINFFRFLVSTLIKNDLEAASKGSKNSSKNLTTWKVFLERLLEAKNNKTIDPRACSVLADEIRSHLFNYKFDFKEINQLIDQIGIEPSKPRVDDLYRRELALQRNLGVSYMCPAIPFILSNLNGSYIQGLQSLSFQVLPSARKEILDILKDSSKLQADIANPCGVIASLVPEWWTKTASQNRRDEAHRSMEAKRNPAFTLYEPDGPYQHRFHKYTNLAIHTLKVIERVKKKPFFQSLSEPEKEDLLLAAWLHDVAKETSMEQDKAQPNESNGQDSITLSYLILDRLAINEPRKRKVIDILHAKETFTKSTEQKVKTTELEILKEEHKADLEILALQIGSLTNLESVLDLSEADSHSVQDSLRYWNSNTQLEIEDIETKLSTNLNTENQQYFEQRLASLRNNENEYSFEDNRKALIEKLKERILYYENTSFPLANSADHIEDLIRSYKAEEVTIKTFDQPFTIVKIPRTEKNIAFTIHVPQIFRSTNDGKLTTFNRNSIEMPESLLCTSIVTPNMLRSYYGNKTFLIVSGNTLQVGPYDLASGSGKFLPLVWKQTDYRDKRIILSREETANATRAFIKSQLQLDDKQSEDLIKAFNYYLTYHQLPKNLAPGITQERAMEVFWQIQSLVTHLFNEKELKEVSESTNPIETMKEFEQKPRKDREHYPQLEGLNEANMWQLSVNAVGIYLGEGESNKTAKELSEDYPEEFRMSANLNLPIIMIGTS